MKAISSRLRRDDRGAAIIELAMVAPVLALMTVGVVDLANGFGRKLALEQAAQRSIEKVMQTTGLYTTEQTIKTEAATQAGVPEANVTVGYRLECNGVENTSSTDCATGETPSSWISVTVTDTYSPLFPVHFAGINSDGTYHLSATAGMRTQ